MNKKKLFLLSIAVISYFAIWVSLIGLVFAQFLGISMHVFGVAGIIFSFIAVTSISLVRCPLCLDYMFKLPWKRKESDASILNLLKEGLLRKKWVCSNCGKTIGDE